MDWSVARISARKSTQGQQKISFRNPQSAIRNPQSAIRNPQSAIGIGAMRPLSNCGVTIIPFAEMD